MKHEKPGGKLDLEEFRRLLRSLPDDAFDGHTEFHRLTAEQRLMWLSQAAQFYFECGGKAKDGLMTADKRKATTEAQRHGEKDKRK